MGQRFADEIARKTANHDVFAQFRDFRADQFLDRLIGILDESLLQQTNRAVKLLEFSVDNFVHHVSGLPLTWRLVNLALGFNQRCRDFLATDIERMRRGDVQA